MANPDIKILLVEDNPGDARLVEEALAEALDETTIKLFTVNRLAEGLKTLTDNPVDVILLDLTLPDSSGWDTFDQVRERAQHTPIILLTGQEDDELARKLLMAGAQDYLVKGQVGSRLLARSIFYAIHRKRAEDAAHLMAETQTQIAHFDQADDIYRLVGGKIQELIGDGFTGITILDEAEQAMKILGLYGFGSLYKNLVQTFKVDVTQIAYPLKYMKPEELRRFRSGKLEIFEGGLYDLLTRKVPKRVCEAAERRLKLSGIYTMGFVVHGEHFGGITIFATGDIAPFKEMIETIVNQATISIHRIRAEQAQRDSGEKYKLLFENMAEGVFYLTADGVFSDVNQSTLEMLGMSRQHFIGSTFENLEWKAIGENGQALKASQYPSMTALRTGKIVRDRVLGLYNAQKQDYVWVRVNAIPQFNPGDDKPYQVFVTLHNITGNRLAEKTLEENEERFREIFENMSSGVVVYEAANDGQDFLIKDFNRAAEKIEKISRETIIGKTIGEVFSGVKDFGLLDVLRRVWKSGRTEHLPVGFYKDDRISGWRENYVARLSSGEVVTIYDDVTGQKQAEEALHESEEHFRNVFENATIGLYRTTPDGRILLANPTLLQMLGYETIEELARRNLEKDGFEPQYQRISFRQRVEREETVRGLESVWKRKDGVTVFVRESAKVIRDDKGAVLYYEGTVEDITERKLAEEALARQDEELRQRNDELSRLYRASGALLSGTYELSALAKTIAEIIQHEFGQANCSVFMIQENTQELNRLAVVGPYAEEVSKSKLSLTGSGLVPQAIRSGQLVNTPNVREIKTYIPNWEAAQAELTVPLLVGSRVVGAIDIQSSEPGAFKAEDEHLLAVFAERAALALEHARLYEQTNRRLQDLVSLRMIDMAISSSFDIRLTLDILLGQLTKRVKVHAADILSFNQSTNTFRFVAGHGFRSEILQSATFRLSDSYAGQVCRERKPVTIQDLSKIADNPQALTASSSEAFITYMGMPLIAKGQTKGVLEIFHREPLTLDQEQAAFLELLAGQAAIAMDNVELFENLQRSNAELRMAYDETIEGWSQATELRDHETEGHTLRAAEITVRLAASMSIGPEDLLNIRRGALLHDVGKIGVSDEILHKPGKLTDEEWAIMRQHPQFAYDLLSPITYLQKALEIPYCHHEKWDGSGYPRGLEGEQIPLAARIFAIVDVWDALNSDRPYRKAWPKKKVFEYLQEQAGKQFDPLVVRSFLILTEK